MLLDSTTEAGGGEEDEVSAHRRHLEELVERTLRGTAHTPPELRTRVAELAKRLASGVEPPEELSSAVQDAVRTISTRAHETTDADLARLREEGLSEDEIFEVVVAAAVGAGRARVEAGLRALGAA
jgi:alkylhydroperoxidase family enzyme